MCKSGKLLITALAMALLTATAQSKPKTIVFATLHDKGTAVEMATDHGVGMANMKIPSAMGIKLSTDQVPAGNVVFKVTNSSKETAHEMLVFHYVEGMQFPYDPKILKIDEDKAGSLGEVSETEPGKVGEVQLDLKPGKYVVLCDVPGHFANGMWALLTVK